MSSSAVISSGREAATIGVLIRDDRLCAVERFPPRNAIGCDERLSLCLGRQIGVYRL